MLYIGKMLHGIFHAVDHLMTKFYRGSLQPEEEFDLEIFQKWLKDNPEISELMALEIVSKIEQYEQCILEITELIALIRKQLEKHDAEVGRIPLPPIWIQTRQVVD